MDNVMWVRLILSVLFAGCQPVVAQTLQEMVRQRENGDPAGVIAARDFFRSRYKAAINSGNVANQIGMQHQAALCDFQLGNHRAAETNLEQLIAAHPKHRLMVLVKGDLGRIYQITWRIEKAEALLSDAIVSAEREGLPESEIALLRLSRAINFVSAGDDEKAKATFESLVKFHAKSRDLASTLGRIECELQLAELDYRAKKSSLALSKTRECLKELEFIAERNRYRSKLIFSAQLGLARYLKLQTRFEDSLDWIDRARHTLNAERGLLGELPFRRHKLELLGASGDVAINAAHAYAGIPRYADDVEVYLRKAMSAADSILDPTAQDDWLHSKEAAVAHGIAGSVWKLTGRREIEAGNRFRAIQSYQESVKRFDAAIEIHSKLSSQLPVLLELRRERCELLIELESGESVVRQIRDLVKDYRQVYGDDTIRLTEALHLLVRSEQRWGDRSTAFKAADMHRHLTTRHLPAYADGLTSSALRSFFFRWDDPALDSCLSLSESTPTESRMIWEWLANAKAKSPEILAAVGTSMRQNHKEERLGHLLEQQAYLLYGSPVDSTTHSKLLELEADKREVVETRKSKASDDWYEAVQLQAAIHEDEAVIDLFTLPGETGRDYHACLVTKDKPPKLVRLGEAPVIDAAIDSLISELGSSASLDSLESTDGTAQREQSLRQGSLRLLSQKLIAPIWPLIQEKEHWMICPDGNLWLLPWNALSVPGDERYLIERVGIRQLISSRDLARRDQTDKTGGEPLVVAMPDYNANVSGGPSILRPESQQLYQVGSEAETVCQILRNRGMNPVLLSEASARKQSILGNDRRPSMIYIATHGMFLSPRKFPVDDPFLCCFLAMAGYNRLPHPDSTSQRLDGVMTAAEVLSADLTSTNLVVLSACQTGQGMTTYGHSASSLRHAFHLAGASAVVSSRWAVSDEATVELMKTFTKGLGDLRSVDKAEALRNAQRELIARLRRGYWQTDRHPTRIYPAHPFLWAAFSVSGF